MQLTVIFLSPKSKRLLVRAWFIEEETEDRHTNSHAADESLNGTLRTRVDSVLRNSLSLTSNGTHHDQTTSNFQILVSLSGNEELTSSVDIHDTIIFLLGDILDMSEGNDTRVGANNIEFTPLLLGLSKEIDDVRDDGNVSLEGNCLGTGLLDSVDDFLGSRIGVGVVYNDFGAATTEFTGHFGTDTTTWFVMLE